MNLVGAAVPHKISNEEREQFILEMGETAFLSKGKKKRPIEKTIKKINKKTRKK